MKHAGTQTILTDRLILRPFVPQDAQPMFENWASDPEVTRFLTWPAYTDPRESVERIQYCLVNYPRPDFYNWAIAWKDHPEDPVGNIAVVNDIDDRLQIAVIGYCIGRHWWHQGITSEALRAVIDFLFQEVDVRKVQSNHDPRNPNSGKVMAKAGLKYEGTLRQTGWSNQGICDDCFYGLLKEEWQNR